MSPLLVCAGGGEGVWAEPGCSPLSPLSSVCVPAVSQLPGMSRLRRVSSLQSPAPIHNIVEFSNSDLHVHDIHNVRRRCTSPLLYVLVSHFTNLIQVFAHSLFSWNWEPFQQSVKSSSLLWILWIKSCFADEGINSDLLWIKMNINVKMGELHNIDTTQAGPSTAPT